MPVFCPLQSHTKPNHHVYYWVIHSNAQATQVTNPISQEPMGIFNGPTHPINAKLLFLYIKQKTCAPRRKCECLSFCKSKVVINTNFMLRKYRVSSHVWVGWYVYSQMIETMLIHASNCKKYANSCRFPQQVYGVCALYNLVLSYTKMLISFYKLTCKMYKKCCLYMLWLTSIISNK